jgi:transcriptional regulator with XRE-family HTH domain
MGSMPKTIFSTGQIALQNLLREARSEAGLTQARLAEKLQRPQSFVAKYEIGERRLDLVELRQICCALNLPLLELVKRFEKSLRNQE